MCRQLGYSSGRAVEGGTLFGPGSAVLGPVMLDDLACRGTEQHVGQCSRRLGTWGANDCTHSEDVGVICTGERVLYTRY